METLKPDEAASVPPVLDQHLDAFEQDGVSADPIDRATEMTRLRQIERIIQPYQQRHYERDTPEIDFGLSL